MFNIFTYLYKKLSLALRRSFYMVVFFCFLFFIGGELVLQWSENNLMKNNQTIKELCLKNSEINIAINQEMKKKVAQPEVKFLKYLTPDQIKIIKKCKKK